MNRLIVICCCVLSLSGCAALNPYQWENATILEPVVVFPSFGSNYLLSCLNDMQTLQRHEFDTKFKLAEAGLENGRNLDKLRYVCLCLNKNADYKQFRQGAKVLDTYMKDNPEMGEDMLGFQVLVERLDEEIGNRWSAWKSLLTDKKELKAEVKSLNIRLEEQHKQIEQLKNIETIIKSRETAK